MEDITEMQNPLPERVGLTEIELRVLRDRMGYEESVIREIEQEVIEDEKQIAESCPPPEVYADFADESDGEEAADETNDDKEFEDAAERALVASSEQVPPERDPFRSPEVARHFDADRVWSEYGLRGFILAYAPAFVDRAKTSYTCLRWWQIQDVLMELELRPVPTAEEIERVCEEELRLPFIESNEARRYDFYYVYASDAVKQQIAADYKTLRERVIDLM